MLKGQVWVKSGSNIAEVRGITLEPSTFGDIPAGTLLGNLFADAEPVRSWDVATFAGIGLTYTVSTVAANFPKVLQRVSEAWTISTTVQTYHYPQDMNVRDLLVVAIATGTLATIASVPSGWTLAANVATTDNRLAVYTRVIDGTEGALGTVAFATASGALVHSWTIDGADGTTAATTAFNSTAGTTLDIGAVAPSWSTAAAVQNLYLVLLGLDIEASSTVSVFPTGYTSAAQDSNVSATAAINGRLAYAEKSASSISEDPSAFTFGSARSAGIVLAIKPKDAGSLNWDGVAARRNGAGSTFIRRRLNFIEGSGVTIGLVDDGVDDEIEVTISASGVPGPSGPIGPGGAQGQQGDQGDQGDPGPVGGTGAAGAPGSPGVAGATGAQGFPGDPGPEGKQGDAGPSGTQGVQGIPGTTGAQGIQGVQGFPGDQGDEGSQGDRGDIGQTGSQGIQGNPGVQGIQGFQGFNGDQGDEGLQGDRGDPGGVGATGTPGSPGTAGATGATGAQGFNGDQGDEGPQGDFVQGPVGPAGANGTTGSPGATGSTGAQGFNGDQGDEGPQGDFIQGPAGVAGTAGTPGVPGPIGPKGDQGPEGEEGPEGREGPPGKDGINGAAGSAGASGSTPPVAGIVLSGTNQSLEILTTTGADLDFEASWNGLAAGVTTPASNSGSIVTATTTANVVPAPAASAQNTIVEVSITNVDTTFNQIVTVQKNTGGTARVLLSAINLAPNERIEFTSDRGWRVFDQAGRERSQANGSIAVAIFTPGTVLGLPITNAASAPGQLLTGDQVGEIIRFSSQFHETGSGTVTYSLPDGFTGATFTPSAAIVLRGITAGTKSGKVLVLSMDRAATFTVTLNHEDGAATAANRFSLPGQANVVLSAGDTLFIWYDPIISRWTILSEQARSISFSGNDYLAGGFVANVLDLIVKDGTNTRVSSSNGGPSPPNGATLAVDHRWTSDNMCLREDFEYSFQSTQAINSGGTNITFSQSSWQLLTNANPGSFSNLGTTVADNPGVIRLTTGSISGDFIVMTKGVGGSASTPILFGNRIRAFEAILVSQSASSDCRIGFIDSVASNNPSNGVYFEFLGSTGVWRGRVVVSSVVYEVGSFTGGPSILTRLRCEIPSIGATPLFYANGTQLTTVTAGSAQAVASNGFCFGVGFFTRTNSLRNLDLDYIEYESQTLSR